MNAFAVALFGLVPQNLRLPRRIEAVVLDADGTSLDPNHKLSLATAAAIAEARAEGISVFLATGRARSGPWVDEQLVPQKLDAPGVFLQGLTAFDADNQRVLNAKLSPSAISAVQRVCEASEESITLAAYLQERLVVACGDECNPWVVRYAGYGDGDIELAAIEAPDVEACDVTNTDLEACLGPDMTEANKILVLADESNVDALRLDLEKALRREPARVVKALDWTLEILPARSSKWAGLKVLLRQLGISPGRVMAVGDGENDMEMLHSVGLPVAMGNAKEPLKEVAAFVTASNAEDGVAKAIREHALPRSPRRIPRKRDVVKALLLGRQ